MTNARMSSARRSMGGTIRRGVDKKAMVGATLRQAGAPAEVTGDHNVCDAFVCANWGLSELGGFCFAQVAA